MHDVSFEEALEFIQLVDSRFHREAYLFVREALDHTQERIGKARRRGSRHVTGQELLAGIRDFALEKFGPMALTLFQEWGVNSCPDFGAIVFNMVEFGGLPTFSPDDFKDLNSFAMLLKQRSCPLSLFLTETFSDATRRALHAEQPGELLAESLAADLNRIIASGPLYDETRFAGLTLSPPAKRLVSHKLGGNHLARLNRLLLENAFPLHIAKSHGVLAKTEQDSPADFEDGYDFHEAFQKPFLPTNKQIKKSENTPAPSGN